MKAIIITIGDEILLGQILDTNSRYIAAALSRMGVDTVEMRSVSDEARAIRQALSQALDRAETVIFTGGLGPTKDDITKKTLADYFGMPLVFREDIWQRVQHFIACYSNRAITEENKNQAMLPQGCVILPNRKGTASGMWFERQGKVVISLPGVPFEAEHLMQEEVLPRLQERMGRDRVQYKMLTVFDVPESALAVQLRDWEARLPEGIKLAYLPSPGWVRLRLTARTAAATANLESVWHTLQQQLHAFKWTENHAELLEQYFAQRLAAARVKIATAESCTGGNIARMITAVPGASAYFMGSVVSYANNVKIHTLGVKESDLAAYGAVSEAVACQMAQGVRKLTGADWAVSTTGIAGPDGGTAQKPVGTVWIGIAGPNGVHAQEFHFSITRERNIARASVKALELLLAAIEQKAD